MEHKAASESFSPTERQILEAAKRVFGKKGMDGARMQEIADEAGLNKALLHYYFRSKEKLFQAVLSEVFSEFFPRIFSTIFLIEMPFKDKIRKFIYQYIELLQTHPYLPGFLTHQFSDASENTEKVVKIFASTGIDHRQFFGEVNNQIEQGKIRPIDPAQLIVNIVSLCIFPYIGAPVISGFLIPERNYHEFLEERREVVAEFVIQAICLP